MAIESEEQWKATLVEAKDMAVRKEFVLMGGRAACARSRGKPHQTRACGRAPAFALDPPWHGAR